MVMIILVKCQICRIRIAETPCPRCGKNVCNIHFDNKKGVCVMCSKGKVL